MYRMKGLAFALLLLAMAPAQAEWTGKGELGGVLARGNTETETINGKIDMTTETSGWKHQAGFSILRTVNDGVTSANRWELRGESDYKLTDRSYVFGALRYEIIDGETTQLDGKIGVGYRRSEFRVSGESENDAIVRGVLDYAHKLTDTTDVTNKFLVEAGSDNTFLQNILSLAVKMNASLALGLSYELRHNTDVLPGTEKTDQIITANLVFGF
jgi:putative salt-induced outer membrane protein